MKKRKCFVDENEEEKKSSTKEGLGKAFEKKINKLSNRCDVCKQCLDEVLKYKGHPEGSENEIITLTYSCLSVVTDKDEIRVYNITDFTLYDKYGHLCPFDTGLIEEGKKLMLSGYVKHICDEDKSKNKGIPTNDIGPIDQWYITGFDGGEKAVVGFSTKSAEYYLLEPSTEYQPIMKHVEQKIYLTKLVIEFLLNKLWESPSYGDLLEQLAASCDPEIAEETLLMHAQFICDHVMSFDAAGNSDDEVLITTPCMRVLIELGGVTLKKTQHIRKFDNRNLEKNATTWSKATTTNLVRDVFETFFVDQIDKGNDKRRKRCGVCELCQTPDCGECDQCRKMLKFGGAGHSKQQCQMRKCFNMSSQDENNESDSEDQSYDEETDVNNRAPPRLIFIRKVQWVGKSFAKFKDRTYYNQAQVGGIVVKSYDYVMINSSTPNKPMSVVQIIYMWEKDGQKKFHAQLFCRGTDTVLGETSNPRELFIVDACGNCSLGSIVYKAKVEQRKTSNNWAFEGGLDRFQPQSEDDGQFFYSKRYDSRCSRFEDIEEEEEEPSLEQPLPCSPCLSCRSQVQKKSVERPTLKFGLIHWLGDVYRTGIGVFLKPNSISYRTNPSIDRFVKKQKIDTTLYPEQYRKCTDNTKGPYADTPYPFDIGLIEEIYSNMKGEIMLFVRKFYRPEDAEGGVFTSYKQDLNLVFWSSEVHQVKFEKVKGKCYLAYCDTSKKSPREWTERGPYRFYFTKGYNWISRKSFDVPPEAKVIGFIGEKEEETEWKRTEKPLSCMDVFAGCGGLTEGLHQSGVAQTKWAIEKEPTAAHAFKINNPDSRVFTADCNELLRKVMAGEQYNDRKLPQKGEVEMIVGGPPCQGFSGMNRFNAGQYSTFKNSLIVSFLSYCDYYRPRYIIFENVRNFVSYKRSIVFKLTLHCLLAIGYQVTFGVVQAGNYGVPQSRRRLIIMAAAPGCVLPKFAEPQHVFSKMGRHLAVRVGSINYYTGVRWRTSAPYRTVTVRDAMADLPDIQNGCNLEEMPYVGETESHFQRMMRMDNSTGIVTEHICKEMAPLVEGRIFHIPPFSGSDWRDLPNIVMELRDGSFTNKLKYSYRSKKQKKGPPRGVCACATGKDCDPVDRQYHSLIPWCLPHTADRHNNWAGLYGRLEWDGFFSTTVTNPEPMGTQGRVLHPEQHRVVSVRECARSQGFPDRYQFYGSIADKHRQVGNAVPPPLGVALGREIQKALALTESRF